MRKICYFYPKNGIFRPQNQTRNPPETRHLIPEPEKKIKTRPDPNPKKISKPEPDIWQPDPSLTGTYILVMAQNIQNLDLGFWKSQSS